MTIGPCPAMNYDTHVGEAFFYFQEGGDASSISSSLPSLNSRLDVTAITDKPGPRRCKADFISSNQLAAAFYFTPF